MEVAAGIELSEIGEDAHETIKDILTGMGLGLTVSVNETEEEVLFEFTTEVYEEALTGNHMELLDAIEHLVDKIVNFDADARKKIRVDCNGKKAQADVDLSSSAMELAEKAMAENQVFKMGPLDPRSRRIVHMALTDVKGVSTRSEGEGAFRRVCIVPQGD